MQNLFLSVFFFLIPACFVLAQSDGNIDIPVQDIGVFSYIDGDDTIYIFEDDTSSSEGRLINPNTIRNQNQSQSAGARTLPALRGRNHN